MRIDEELILMSEYKLTPNELYLIRTILMYEDDEQYIAKYLNVCKITNTDVRSMLLNLQEKGIVLKSYKVPDSGTVFKPEDVDLNQNFIKRFHRASFELGQELFDVYPQFTVIQGCTVPLRSVSKKFDSLEDFFKSYGKTIKNNPDLHNHIIELTKWAAENTSIINCTLASYVIDRRWMDIEALKTGDKGNVNFDTVKML